MRLAFIRSASICLSFLLILYAAGCSNDSNVSVAPEMLAQKKRTVLDPRTNPLQTYIRDTWTEGDPDATGGLIRSHIKVYGHNHKNMVAGSPPCPNAAADVTFVTQNYDMFMWGGHAVGQSADPDMLWFQEAANIAHIRTGWDTNNVNAWLPTTNYKWFDIALHYQIDTANAHATQLGLPYFRGWNPADDFDGDGIIEAGEGNNGAPTDPNRSAMDVAEARVRMGNGWIKANVAGPAYAEFIADIALDEWANGIDGYHFDEAAFENQGNTLQNTFTYWDAVEGSPEFQYVEDRIAFPSAVMPMVEAVTGPVVALTNMVATSYATVNPVQRGYALQYLENILIEAWLTNSVNLVNLNNRTTLLDDVYTYYLEAGKGVVFGVNDQPPSERMKLFSLAMFYMVNHQMAFYWYRGVLPADCDMATTQFNPWVNFDVGAPMENDLGLTDFQGNSNTDRYFVFHTDPDHNPPHYRVLGRLYRRLDGNTYLVLAKLMAFGHPVGGEPTSIPLGGTYKKVLSNFQLGLAITSVSLTNNEAVILRRSTGGGGGCGGCLPDG